MFGRKKKQQLEEAAGAVAEDAQSSQTTTEDAGDHTPSAPAAGPGKSERTYGPHDASEVEDSTEGLIDLGSLRIRPVVGMQMNLEVEPESQQIVSVAIELGESRMTVQAFAAPKSEGLWEGISTQIDASITQQGGRTDRREGKFGPELLARVPMTGEDGSQGAMVARFVGIDGPRWFLRAVFGGPAAINDEAAAELEEVLGGMIVDRGNTPMAPTELLPLQMPEAAGVEPKAQGAHVHDANEVIDEGERGKDPRRGPEITEIG